MHLDETMFTHQRSLFQRFVTVHPFIPVYLLGAWLTSMPLNGGRCFEHFLFWCRCNDAYIASISELCCRYTGYYETEQNGGCCMPNDFTMLFSEVLELRGSGRTDSVGVSLFMKNLNANVYLLTDMHRCSSNAKWIQQQVSRHTMITV